MRLSHKLIIALSSLLLYVLIGDTELELIIAFTLILIVGIPHGSTDHLLSGTLGNDGANKLSLWQFVLLYLSVMISYASIWYFYESVAFTIFLVISAYHFGEAQLIRSKMHSTSVHITYLLWGSTALLVLFLPHLPEIEALIVPYLISSEVMKVFSTLDLYILGIAIIPLFVLLYIHSPKLFFREALELLILYVISYNTSLLVGFAVFFAFWHSYDATIFQVLKLSALRKDFNLKSWVKAAAPYTIVSWLGIVLIIILANQFETSWPLITLFFIIVSLITLPHVIVMSRFYTEHNYNS
jgi:Brp/Blh family beta-carotene 15,15'-monooxygenase